MKPSSITHYFNKKLFLAIKNKDFQSIVKFIVENSISVLDVGCGLGDYLQYTNDKQRVVAVEPHEQYIHEARKRVPWATFMNTDALTYFKTNNEQFDVVLLIDIIEHLEEENARKLVQESIKHCNNIVFSQIPIGIHQQTHDEWNLGGEYWQTHRSTWNKDNIEDLGFTFYQIWEDWYEWDETETDKSRDTSIAIWSQHPLVSVVVPTYNQAEWLPKTLNSILDQTYPFWEAIVVNDGSTDQTNEVISKYEKIDHRIKGINKSNGGISSALNAGIQRAKGKYFCWLSSDDLFYPDKLEVQVRTFLELDDSYGIVFGGFDLTDLDDNVREIDHKKPFYDGMEFPQCLKYDYIDGCTIMIPMEIMRTVNGFNSQFKHAQDTELWFRLAAKGYKFSYIDKKLTLRRMHPDQGFTDFALDCRYDGYRMVDFYLSNYSFREFYRNIDFNNQYDLWQFIRHFYDMIGDPNCHINHPTVNDKFWNWFVDGLKTLTLKSRDTILQAGIVSFGQARRHGQFWQKYYQKIKQLQRQLKHKNPVKVACRSTFRDITQYDYSQEIEYSKTLFDYGMELYQSENEELALGVFKYLSDFQNPYYEKALKYFIELTNTRQKFQTFIKSFRRKPPIQTFPDEIQAYFLWCQQSIDIDNLLNEALLNNIKNDEIRKQAENWLIFKNYSDTHVDQIQHWNYHITSSGILHLVSIRCSNCGNESEFRFSFPISKDPSQMNYICHRCFYGYRFSDDCIFEYFQRNLVKPSGKKPRKGTSKKVTFILRYTSQIGGGIKKVFQHIKWLHDLGCKITIYSDDSPPTWIKLPGKFITVKDHYEDNLSNADLVVVFSIYDVPKVLTKVTPGKVVHFCQGYEGYHIGENYEAMRSDKHFYTELHRLPVQNILVSDHLIDLFEKKFGRKGYYVPNGIDHSIFKPNLNQDRVSNSILFIGNPHDKLKGFKFLSSALKHLQNSPKRLDYITLHIVQGVNNYDLESELFDIPNLRLKFHNKLSSKEVARLCRQTALLINTSWYEGFSMPVLEGMASGIPVITTNNMGAESFCVDGYNDFVVKYGDVYRLQRLIREILNGRIDLNEIIHNALNTSLEYSELNSFNSFVQTYSTLLNTTFNTNRLELLKKRYEQSSCLGGKLLEESNNWFSSITGKDKLVSIIILTYNAVEFTKKCVRSIKQNTNHKYEFIFVDNASQDGTLQYLEQLVNENPNYRLIRNHENKGFAAGNNQGMKIAKGDYILLLNNDVLVSEGWLERLVACAEMDPGIGLVGPLTNWISGWQRVINVPYKDPGDFPDYAKRIARSQAKRYTPRRRIAGFAMLIKRAVFEKIGGLDERFGNGNYEDDDYCLRAKEVGYKIMVAEDVFIHHFGSQTFKQNQIDYTTAVDRNKRLFSEKWPDINSDWLMEKTTRLTEINEKLCKQGQRAILDSEIDSAQSYYSEILETNPIHNEALLGLALCARFQEDYETAMKHLHRLLELNPNHAAAYNQSGIISTKIGDLDSARTFFTEAIKKDPTFLDAQRNYGEILLALGEYESGIQVFYKILEHYPEDVPTLLRIAQIQAMTGNDDEAKKYIEKALIHDPGNPAVKEFMNTIHQQ